MKRLLISIVVLSVLAASYLGYAALVANPRVEREVREAPDGERARKVMLMTLPSGRTIPVNYLREGNVVYVGADGRWWRQFRGEGARVQLLLRGETLSGRALAIDNDPDHRAAVFSRLRPTAPKFTGTLIQIELDPRT